VNGIVYISGFGFGGDVYALNETNGTLLWTMPVDTGDGSSPAVNGGKVFESYACPEVYVFNAVTGQQLWHYNSCCDGGGGLTPVVHAGRVYCRASICTPTNGLVLNANNGTAVGEFNSDTPPVFFGNLALFVQSGTLVAVVNGRVVWIFPGDGALQSAPVIVNQTIYIGSRFGMLYGLNATGQQIWSTQVGASIPPPEPFSVTLVTGLGAGDGLLIVPTASTLVAYGN
jgi:outer membrane protein assembly factor BamB